METYPINRLDLAGVHNDFIVQTADKKRELEGLSKLNLFVGPNNSGKSRFLRELARMPKPRFIPTRDLKAFKDIRAEMLDRLPRLFPNVEDVSDFKKKLLELSDFSYVQADDDVFTPWVHYLHKVATATRHGIVRGSTHYGNEDLGHSGRQIQELGKEMHEKFSTAVKGLPTRWKFRRIYIPTLRGLRPLGDASDLYKARTKQDYFEKEEHVEIETGLALYRQIRSLLLGNLTDRRVVTRFQHWLGQVFFNGVEVALIPREQADNRHEVLHVKIGNAEEHPIHELGDGIQMIIAIVFPLFRATGGLVSGDQQVLCFVEEPELYLHPGMQRILCNALAMFPNTQCFLATHSNHLLDLTLDRADIAVYSVTSELVDTGGLEHKATSTVELLSTANTRILSGLGVRNSSVFLSNCTVWVEGITDRRYLRHFLRLYICHHHKLTLNDSTRFPYKEDLHYSFVEYGGSNITHWSFLDDDVTDKIVVDRLCGKLFLVADRDNSNAKDERHKKLKEKLGDRFAVHERREIENLLSPDTLTRVLAEYEGATGHVPAIKYEQYGDQSMGAFIDGLLGKKRKRKGLYAADGGTLTDKPKFCDRAVAAMEKWGDLSQDAQDLAKRIYDFIAKQNPS